MPPENDYYAVLGVPRDGDADLIRKAFRERVRACHPDRVANLDEDLRKLAEEKMVELNAAYAVLRNPARRAAYDDRSAKQHLPEAVRSPTGTRGATDQPPVETRPGQPMVDPAGTRNRIGEQRFVSRAASEEFRSHVERCVPGQVSWTPMAFPGATQAFRGARARSSFSFVLLAAPKVDDKTLRRFLKSLDGSAPKLKSRLFGRDLLFGFVGAVEFLDQRRQRATLERFNEGRSLRDAVRPATLVDLVNWHVVPGEIRIQERLESLLRGH